MSSANEASASLKVLLLVFALVLIGALAFIINESIVNLYPNSPEVVNNMNTIVAKN